VGVSPLFNYLIQEKGFGPRYFRKNDRIGLAEKIPSIKSQLEKFVGDLESVKYKQTEAKNY